MVQICLHIKIEELFWFFLKTVNALQSGPFTAKMYFLQSIDICYKQYIFQNNIGYKKKS